MALRLEENEYGENSSRFLCLFGSECGGGRMTSWKKAVVRSRCLNFRGCAISNLRETCGFPVSLWALKGVKLRVTFLLGFAFCLFVCFDPLPTLFWTFAADLATLPLGSPLGMTVSGSPVPLPPSYQTHGRVLSRCPVSLPSFPTNRIVLHPYSFIRSHQLLVLRARVQCFVFSEEVTFTHSKKILRREKF